MVTLWQTNRPGTYSSLDIAVIFDQTTKDYVIYSHKRELSRAKTLIKAQAFIIQMLRQDLTNDIAARNRQIEKEEKQLKEQSA